MILNINGTIIVSKEKTEDELFGLLLFYTY